MLRESLGLTQREVAERLGMSDGGYSSVERGHARMFVTDIARFAGAFGVAPAYLARRLSLCGDDDADLAATLVQRFGPGLGGVLVRLDRIAANMQADDQTALTVMARRILEPYERAEGTP